MSCAWKYFFISHSDKRSMRPPHTFTLRNKPHLKCVFCLYTGKTLSESCVSKCVWGCVCVSERLASPVSFTGTPMRTEGHWDNYKTTCHWKRPKSSVCRRPPSAFSSCLPPPSFSPPPANWHHAWCHQATPTHTEAALGNRGNGFNPE